MTAFTIKIIARKNAAHQVETAIALQQGFNWHGLNSEIITPDEYTPCDLVVRWGVRDKRIQQNQEFANSDMLVMEQGYLGDRMQQRSLGFNGLNGRAEFHAETVSSDRGREFYDLIQPWKTGGRYFLVCGQVLGDMSLEGVDYAAWLESIPREIDGLPVYFRPHPVRCDYKVPHEVINGPLHENLRYAAGVITYNSNSGLDALLAGVRTVTFDAGSMVYDDTGHDLQSWQKPDRKAIVDRIAYCQWSLSDMAEGTAWEHLKVRYD